MRKSSGASLRRVVLTDRLADRLISCLLADPPPPSPTGSNLVSTGERDVTKLLHTYVTRELGSTPAPTPMAAHALLKEALLIEFEFDAERFTTLEVSA